MEGQWQAKSNVSWLTTVPANDVNFKCHLEYATVEELERAIAINKESGAKSRVAACERELRKRKRKEIKNERG